MAVLTIAELKAKFETGDIPDGDDFVDFIDTLVYGSVSSVPASGATLTLTLDDSSHEVVLTNNCVITFPTPPFDFYVFELVLIQDATGNWSVSFSDTIEWDVGANPTLTKTPGNTSILTFSTRDGGSSWFGSLNGDEVS